MKMSWTSCRVAALLLVALPALTQAYPDRLSGGLSSYSVGVEGPMSIAELQAGNAQTCAIDAAAASGYTPGQVYTIQVSTNGEHAFEPSGGAVADNSYNQNSYQWTAPNSASPVTFRALCATGRNTGYFTSAVVLENGAHCTAGTFSADGTGDNGCTDCPQGYHQASSGSTFCLPWYV